MGNEVKLFYLKCLKKMDITELEKVLLELGCVKVTQTYPFSNTQYYEINTKKGITEIQVDYDNSNLTETLSVRFSYGNPITIFNQTINFFKKLEKNIPIEIYATEPLEKIVLNKEQVNIFKKYLLIKKRFFDEHYMKINKPIRGGKETFEYIKKHKKVEL